MKKSKLCSVLILTILITYVVMIVMHWDSVYLPYVMLGYSISYIVKVLENMANKYKRAGR